MNPKKFWIQKQGSHDGISWVSMKAFEDSFGFTDSLFEHTRYVAYEKKQPYSVEVIDIIALEAAIELLRAAREQIDGFEDFLMEKAKELK